ncbi:hypothetical protein GYMLUDRAFT_61949 [Collybiopsis luxurians FD-317 M1]|uniref:Uncharacterized protein n=1 Tax=Collybiopsis luxurians FD-317 M1 TaxID=944289 RepID=A0A0D0CES0_9AGAR|nr:hypothetical protein GYMLUDRAFT_61949 [Collybiopsis luxurians FD-317 M1]
MPRVASSTSMQGAASASDTGTSPLSTGIPSKVQQLYCPFSSLVSGGSADNQAGSAPPGSESRLLLPPQSSLGQIYPATQPHSPLLSAQPQPSQNSASLTLQAQPSTQSQGPQTG